MQRTGNILTAGKQLATEAAPGPRFIASHALATVPRYTSFPPANRFDVAIDEGDYRQWLAAIVPDEPLSLYVHVPFCKSLCWYCGCHTTVPNRQERVVEYLGALQREIGMVAKLVNPQAPVTHVHFGGGTPNYLSPDELDGVIGALKQGFPFSDDTEIAMEIDPRSLDDGHIETLTRYGSPRISIGVQDISADVQALINREQPFEIVEDCVKRLRRAGVAGINIDLIYGLPGQSVDHVVHSATRCAALGPDRFAVFGYAHVPWFKKNQRAIDEARLPGARERFDQSLAVAKALTDCGYTAIGLDHYARSDDPLCTAQAEGRLRRNFQGYTTDPTDVLIGFGASSIGTFRQGHVQNDPHLLGYAKALDAGRLPVVRGIALTPEHRRTGAVIERLMCDFSVDLAAAADQHGCEVDVFAPALSTLDPLCREGLVEIDGNHVRATAAGETYIRIIAACFDSGFAPQSQRHARSV